MMRALRHVDGTESGTPPKVPSAALGGRTHRLALLSLLVVVVALASLATVVTRGIGSESRKAADSAAVADHYQDARFYAAQALGYFDEYRLHNDTAFSAAAADSITKIQQALNQLGEVPGQAQTIADLKRKAKQIIAMGDRSDKLSAAGRTAAAMRADQQADEAAQSGIAELSGLERSAHLRSETQLTSIRTNASRLGYATPFVLLGVLLLALWVSIVLHRDRRRMARLATTDPLTGLPNRLGLANVVDRALRRDHDEARCGWALLLLDLDRFKEINDGLGHEYGDELLRAAARRLRQCVSPTDTVARIGGDEFVVLLAASDAAQAESAAKRMRAALCAPFAIDGVELALDVSIGIALAGGEASTFANPSALLRAADLAMYAAKEAGGGHVLYTSALGTRITDKVTIVGQVRRALDHDELVLFYQPQVGLDDNRLVGVEALLRWQHPVRGILPPAEFLPAVEDHQIIDRVTHVVLSKALRQMKIWQSEGLHIPISVNIATRTLLNTSFPTEVADLLRDFDVDPSLLCLEVTETSVMRDSGRCARTLHALHDLGVRLSVDDYGTGYASMVYLKDLPIDELKIDRSFVARMTEERQHRVLTQSVIELGHNLGLSVVAEGVEDHAVCQALRASGCDVAQGYLYSRPVPPEEVLAWSAGATETAILDIPAQRTGNELTEPA
jgi:diguanylate cyclase (GGDEF)-like protein